MFKLLVTLGVVMVAVASVWAGEIYLELPGDFDAEMVYHPTDANRRALAEFTLDALADLDNRYTVRIVRFTKNGKPISRDYGQGKDMEAPPIQADVHFLKGWGFSDKQWEDLEYHLHYKGQEFGFNGVYDLAEEVFGEGYAYDTGGSPPIMEREVYVSLYEFAPDWGLYNPDIDEIYLRNWRVGDEYPPVIRDTDRAYFTRCMLHAFRGPWPAPWDHFDAGTVHAAWLEIQARLYRNGYDVNFNDLGHYEKMPEDPEYARPYYTYLENYNSPGLSSRIASFDSDHCELNYRIRRYRYGACGYCWWKVLQYDPDFIHHFSGELCKVWRILYPGRPSYEQLYAAAAASYEGGLIEEKSYADWFAEQPILNLPTEVEDVCAVTVNKSKVEVFNYHRQVVSGYDEEVPNELYWPGSKVVLKKTDWQGNVESVDIYNLDEGYGVWEPTMNYDNSKFRVAGEYWQYPIEPPEWLLMASSNSSGVDTDEAYENDEIFAVVADAVGGGGQLQVIYNGDYLGTYNVVKYVARIPNFTGGDEAGAGEYTFAYSPPEGLGFGSRSVDPTPTISKDGGCFFDVHGYLSTPEGDGGAGVNSSVPAVDKRISLSPHPEAGFRPSPDAGKYLAPDAGALPGGGELGAPGSDMPPTEGPPMTAPVGFGGDSLSGEGTSSGLMPPAPAAPAEPLSCGPNPVSTSARITFKLEAPCAVKLAVYDLSGRKVATLAEGRYDAGEHVVEWRADVPTGVYIYRLDAAGKVATRKLVVAK